MAKNNEVIGGEFRCRLVFRICPRRAEHEEAPAEASQAEASSFDAMLGQRGAGR
jgi:hypothetical protein